MDHIDELFALATECARYNRGFSIATITGAQGRTPRKDGRMLVLPSGRTCGTVGGGAAEREVVALAVEAMKAGKGRRVQIQVREYGMLDVFIDVPIRGRKAVIFGTGHIAKSVADVLFHIGFEVFFIDDYAVEHGFSCPANMTLLSSDKLQSIAIDNKTAIIFSNPQDRDKYIEAVLATESPYIGVLSSKLRPTIDNPRIRQPIGLDIGAETPEEIAVSIAAQILAVFNGKK